MIDYAKVNPQKIEIQTYPTFKWLLLNEYLLNKHSQGTVELGYDQEMGEKCSVSAIGQVQGEI